MTVNYIKNTICLYTLYIFLRLKMAIEKGGVVLLRLPEPMRNFKSRELRWLWWYLEPELRSIDEQRLQYDDISNSDRIQRMAKAIKSARNPSEFENQIMTCYNDNIVPEEHLQWIDKENHRLLIWCINNLSRNVRERRHSQLTSLSMPYLSRTLAGKRYESIITAIDIWETNKEEKINFLLQNKNEWSNYKTPDKEIKWLNSKDKDQIVWAWEYLEKHQKSFRVPKPDDMKECYDLVLASFDDLSYGHPAAKKLFLEQMKRTWSQKKFRDSGKAKKPYYLPLTIKTREKLEWLADNSGQKPAEILEQLIEESYSKYTKTQ